MADAKKKKVEDIVGIGDNRTPQPHESHGLEQPQPQLTNDPLADLTGQIFENPAPPVSQVMPTTGIILQKETPAVHPNGEAVSKNKKTNTDLPGTDELKVFSQQNYQPTPQVANIYKPQGKKNNLKIALVGFFALLLVAFGLTTLIKGDLYWVRDMLGMGLPNNPIKALEKAEQKTNNLNSYKTDSTMDINASLLGDELNLSMIMSGEQDNVNKNFKQNIEIKEIVLPKSIMGMELPKEVDSTISDIKSKTGRIELSSFEANKEIYLKIDGIDDTWYKIEGFPGLENLSNLSVLSSNDKKIENPILGSVMYSQDLGAKVNNEISSIIKDAKKLKDETLENERVYRYTANIDIAKLMDGVGSSELEITEIEKYLKKTTMDIWIAKKNLVITKIDLNLNLDMTSELQGTGEFNIEIKASQDIKDYNLPVSIEKPTDSKTLDEDALAKMFEIPLDIDDISKDDFTLRNTQRETDIKTIQTALEEYFAKNNKYPVISDDSKDGSFLDDLKGEFLVKVPIDPNNPKYYYSYSSLDGSNYTITYINEKTDGTIEIKTAKSY